MRPPFILDLNPGSGSYNASFPYSSSNNQFEEPVYESSGSKLGTGTIIAIVLLFILPIPMFILARIIIRRRRVLRNGPAAQEVEKRMNDLSQEREQLTAEGAIVLQSGNWVNSYTEDGRAKSGSYSFTFTPDGQVQGSGRDADSAFTITAGVYNSTSGEIRWREDGGSAGWEAEIVGIIESPWQISGTIYSRVAKWPWKLVEANFTAKHPEGPPGQLATGVVEGQVVGVEESNDDVPGKESDLFRKP